jgi:ABC-2 type transport system ATP-binding protein
MICLQVEGLTKQFGQTAVVNDVSFELMEHTATALIGPNGAGKTTTLSMLTGLLQPTNGQVRMPGVKDIRREIGFLPQYPQFFSWMTALQYVEMAAELNDVPKREVRSRSENLLHFVGLGDARNKKIATFSGGMKQRLGIAQAIIHEPKLILLDEPVSALDPVGRREMMELLKNLQQKTTILYSTHILNDAEQMTDQVLFLKEGRLVEKGLLTDVTQRYEEPKLKVQFKTFEQATRFAESYEYAVYLDGLSVTIPIHNNQPTMQQLLSYFANSAYDIQKIEQMTSSLEEIFMKVASAK